MRPLRFACLRKLDWKNKVCALLLLCVATAIALPAQTFTTLHSFDSTDGGAPEAAPVQGLNGNLYGTTKQDGANGAGTVFEITAGGTLTTLYNFCSIGICTDGADPTGVLVQATNGDLYGTTTGGGTHGAGTVFKITSAGVLTTLYSFCSETACKDGEKLTAGLLQAANGDFYGTTEIEGDEGDGTVFKITQSGMVTVLYNFCSLSHCADGEGASGLIQATNGIIYGTTYGGGANNDGTVFKITPAGVLTTLHSFDSTDGANPLAGLVQAANGDFYGTTYIGGAYSEGTVFKMTPGGTLTTLYSFCSQTSCPDGANPYDGLVQGTDGNFYGTTYAGGANLYGTIFQITAAGTLTTLHSFDNSDGELTEAGLFQATNGILYGTTYGGGADFSGTVFSLSVPSLGASAETLPTSGKVGAPVKILGNNLTGATGVSFNGTAAAFKVVSSSLITATVPTGATTGPVRVTTPSGTLKSNKKFVVTP
jgi:uncharacterized repeat protein (TIGR03803 family)